MRWFLLSRRIQGSERVGVVLLGENGTKQNGGRNPRAHVSPWAIGRTHTALLGASAQDIFKSGFGFIRLAARAPNQYYTHQRTPTCNKNHKLYWILRQGRFTSSSFYKLHYVSF